FELEFQINESTRVAAVLLALPETLKAVQRRGVYRVPVPADSDLRLRMWRIPEHACVRDRPLASAELKASLANISIGGIGAEIVGKGEEPPRITEGERVRLELTHADGALILEARVRHVRIVGDRRRARCGLNFKKLEENLEGRQAQSVLTRIVGQLQRDEARRMRLGLAS
ncbi:MAG: PilZ domain-containing protein, partial [Tepidisphaeraceae bacterium]